MGKKEIKSYESYIGSTIEGFAFTKIGELKYAIGMDKYVGKKGRITEFHDVYPVRFKVDFSDDFWYYPADECIKIIEKNRKKTKYLFNVYEAD